ncbi:Glycosyl transferase WecB/TagA/CpsF [Syntrophomonas zehnderi OL-4]|uniref:N-acetylglucosaminyldiphosphoundecaprenol N-acetyl-beta-D-mannosaminyltransferase n=1 Tax=Syntrophomonas zehnderi OL-4 TaxID=690567 RepID=A0A0E4G9F2_9FIRM|nr:WecB/TagA/CpsF family glycosyltransferase [Syntrophomonas zehnderi]CFX03403.1 Glycosyl transferase WecB/TagA/CpsF [Syntrophomonas zehnderi OL-4]
MKSNEKALILGANVDIVDFGQALQRIKQLIKAGTPSHIITLNAEILYQAQDNEDLLNVINAADLVTPDGIGIVWAGKKLGYPFLERVTGIDLLYLICEEAAQESWKIYMLGAAPNVAETAAKQLTQKYPGLKICGCHDGYFASDETDQIIEDIKKSQPDILFVALGAPKQEFWIKEHKDALSVPVLIGVGGSFDVVAGIKERAPEWVIKANLEWLYRLVKEPSRFKRQLALPRFTVEVLKQKAKTKD